MNARREHSSGEKVYQIAVMLTGDWGGINGVLPRSGLVQGMLCEYRIFQNIKVA